MKFKFLKFGRAAAPPQYEKHVPQIEYILTPKQLEHFIMSIKEDIQHAFETVNGQRKAQIAALEAKNTRLAEQIAALQAAATEAATSSIATAELQPLLDMIKAEIVPETAPVV